MNKAVNSRESSLRPVRIFILLASLSITQVLGDILLSRGMKDFVGFDFTNPMIILYLIIHILTNSWILMGLGSLVTSLTLYLTAISKLDLSYVLPIHASSYVLNGLFAWVFLGESIPGMRWISTLIISCGVLFVGLSESQTSQFSGEYNHNIKPRNSRHYPAFLLPLSLAVSKTWLAVIISSISDASGDLLLALGMKKIAKVDQKMTIKNIVKLVFQVITNPMILSGIACQGIAFFSFISVLSWADISFVRPATALTYIISMTGAKFVLKENIKEHKLLGIILIGVGVFMHR